jgi:tetratricopeptide (TPR) repeat protein
MEIDTTDRDAGVLRIDFVRCAAPIVTIEPVGESAAALWAAAQDPLSELESVVGRLSDQIAANPRNGRALSERGTVLARLGRFYEAKADLDRALALDPEMESCATVRTGLLAYLGEDDAHRAAARDVGRRPRDPFRPEVWARSVTACLALPGVAAEECDRLREQAAEAVSHGGPMVAWSHMAHGMAAHRTGPAHDEAAVAALDRAVAGLAGDPLRHARATSLYVRAIALHRLGRRDEARAAFAAAEGIARATGGVPGTDDLGAAGVEYWFACQTVRREAGRLFGAPTAAADGRNGPATQP